MHCSCTNCRASFDLKDEFLGKQLECPNCKNIFTAKEDIPTESISPNGTITEKGIFGKHKYGIKQKKIAINEKYYIKDENNNDLFFSVRRIYFWRRFSATFIGIILFILSIIFGSSIIANIEGIIGIMLGAILILTGLFLMVWIISIASRRGIEFYMSENEMNQKNPEFIITQDNIYEIINQNYTLKHDEKEIAKFSKNIFTNILRKTWHLHFDNKHIIIKEESVVLGILRRLGIPFIRTNFIFIDATHDPKSSQIIGYFKRKFEIFDNYLLDMTSDPAFIVPREIGICMAVLLDCGERR